MMSGAQHRFSERYVVVILGFPRPPLFRRGDIERSINVDVPTVIHEEPAQQPQLVRVSRMAATSSAREKPSRTCLLFPSECIRAKDSDA